MHDRKRLHRMPFPSPGHLLVAMVTLCTAWLCWREFCERGGIPGYVPHRTTPGEAIRRVEERALLGRNAVPEFVKALSDSNPKIRRNALLGLGHIGPDAKSAIEQVRCCLTDENAQVRAYAVEPFWRISHKADEVAPILASMLRDNNDDVREAAAKTLQAIGHDATPSLLALLRDKSAMVRNSALRVLRLTNHAAASDDVADAVRELVDDPDREIQLNALVAEMIWRQPKPSDIRKLLLTDYTGISCGSSSMGKPLNPIDVALEAISRLGPAAEELLPDVIELLGKEEPLELPTTQQISLQGGMRRTEVAPRLERLLKALASMQALSRPTAPQLLRLAATLHGPARLSIATTLVAIGAPPSDVTPLLVSLLTDSDADSPENAGRLLVDVNPEEARRQVSVLIGQLLTDDGSVNALVLNALIGLAPQAREEVPALIALLDHRERLVFNAAARILRTIGPDAEAAVPALIAILVADSRDDWDRATAARTLGTIAHAARAAVPALIEAIRDPAELHEAESPDPIYIKSEYRAAAINALAAIHDARPSVLSALHAQISSESVNVRLAAMHGLVRLADNSPAVLDELVKLLSDSHANARANAALAISSVKADCRHVVGRLSEALTDENPYVRTAAAISLGEIGLDAKAAIPALRAAADDDNNAQSNLQYDMSFKRGRPRHAIVYLPRLYQISVTEAARTAISKIERDPASEALQPEP